MLLSLLGLPSKSSSPHPPSPLPLRGMINRTLLISRKTYKIVSSNTCDSVNNHQSLKRTQFSSNWVNE